MLSNDIQMMILQISRPQDRNAEETAIAADGMMPITLFADGPDKAFLIGARPEDLATVFAAAIERADGYGADRLALRMRAFSDLSDAINTQFKYLADPSDFPNAVTFLLVEALAQIGFRNADDIRPCAVRYLRNQMETPDYEDAPSGDEPMDNA
jgi:hypothetical protein